MKYSWIQTSTFYQLFQVLLCTFRTPCKYHFINEKFILKQKRIEKLNKLNNL